MHKNDIERIEFYQGILNKFEQVQIAGNLVETKDGVLRKRIIARHFTFNDEEEAKLAKLQCSDLKREINLYKKNVNDDKEEIRRIYGEQINSVGSGSGLAGAIFGSKQTFIRAKAELKRQYRSELDSRLGSYDAILQEFDNIIFYLEAIRSDANDYLTRGEIPGSPLLIDDLENIPQGKPELKEKSSPSKQASGAIGCIFLILCLSSLLFLIFNDPSPQDESNNDSPSVESTSTKDKRSNEAPTPTPVNANPLLEPTIEPPEPDTSQIQVIVIENSINVRSGPGIEYEPVGFLYKDDVISLVEQNDDGSWIKIEFSGNLTGWVGSTVVEFIDSIPTQAP